AGPGICAARGGAVLRRHRGLDRWPVGLPEPPRPCRHVRLPWVGAAAPQRADLGPAPAQSLVGRAVPGGRGENRGVELTLLGTGAPADLPRPNCPCAAYARAPGPDARAATSLLVDGALLLDLTPGAAFAAAPAGRPPGG